MKNIVVVGAGITGASHALELSRIAGVSITLIDSVSGPAMNLSTGSSSACIRRCYSSKELSILANYGVGYLDELKNSQRDPSLLVMNGCLTLGMSDSSFIGNQKKIYRELNFELTDITAEGLQKSFPDLNVESSEIGVFDYRSGYSSPHQVTSVLVGLAKINGAKTIFNSKVVAILSEGHRVSGVQLESGRTVPADYVILASSFGTKKLLANLALKPAIPETSIRPVFTAYFQLGLGDAKLPVIADITNEIYARPEGAGILVGSLSEIDEETRIESMDPDFVVDKFRLESLIHRTGCRFPNANLNSAQVRVVRGFYDVNDSDWMPLQCEYAIDGLYVSYASSGHGFKLAFGLSKLLLKQMGLCELPESLSGIESDLFALSDQRIKATTVLA